MNEKINYGYVISWVVVATIGMYVFGYSLSSFNIMTNYMYYHYKYNNIKGFYMKDINVFNSIITSVVPIGAAIGALFGGKLASIGRRESAIVLSVGSIWGWLSTIALNFYFLVVGRFAIGLAWGATSVVIPMLVSEVLFKIIFLNLLF